MHSVVLWPDWWKKKKKGWLKRIGMEWNMMITKFLLFISYYNFDFRFLIILTSICIFFYVIDFNM